MFGLNAGLGQTNNDTGDSPLNSAARTEKPWRAEEQSDHLDASASDTATLHTNAHRHATERIKDGDFVFDSVAVRPSGFKRVCVCVCVCGPK